METKEFKVWSPSKFEAEIAELNKKLKKYDLEITYSKGEKVVKKERWYGVLCDESYWVYTVNNPIEAIQIPGFKYLGTRAKDGILHSVDEKYHLRHLIEDNNCDHCNTKRRRLIMHYFLNIKEDCIVKIGSNCADEYLGINIAHRLNKAIVYLESIGGEDSEWGHSYGSNRAHDFGLILSLAYNFLSEVKGYISKNKAEQTPDQLSTSEIISNYYSVLRSNASDKIKKEARKYYGAIPEDDSKAICNYYEDLDPQSDFEFNLNKVFSEQLDRIGIIAYGVYKWLKKNKFDSEEQALINHSHFGEIKKRYRKQNVKLVNVVGFDSCWGWSNVYKFLNADNQVLVWITSASQKDLIAGDEKEITFTVKDHTEFHGIVQTKISRVEVEA